MCPSVRFSDMCADVSVLVCLRRAQSVFTAIGTSRGRWLTLAAAWLPTRMSSAIVNDGWIAAPFRTLKFGLGIAAVRADSSLRCVQSISASHTLYRAVCFGAKPRVKYFVSVYSDSLMWQQPKLRGVHRCKNGECARDD